MCANPLVNHGQGPVLTEFQLLPRGFKPHHLRQQFLEQLNLLKKEGYKFISILWRATRCCHTTCLFKGTLGEQLQSNWHQNRPTNFTIQLPKFTALQAGRGASGNCCSHCQEWPVLKWLWSAYLPQQHQWLQKPFQVQASPRGCGFSLLLLAGKAHLLCDPKWSLSFWDEPQGRGHPELCPS